MDHLPLPRHAVLGSLDISFLCDEQYDGGPFLTYPERTGWNVTEYEWPDSLTHEGKEISDEGEILSFLQRWLYLGLLREVTGKAIDATVFRAPGRTRGAYRFSSEHLEDIVGKWSLEAVATSYDEDPILLGRLGEDAEFLGDPFNTWLSSRQDIIDAAEDSWQRIVETYKDSSSARFNLVCLSIAALGDYLSQALADIARERGVDDDARSAIWLLPESVCQPVLRHMTNWCPNRLHGFLNTQGCTVGVLWYIANLKPPKVHDGHHTCTPERCNSLHVDLHDYTVKHVSRRCHCALAGPSMEEMVGIVRRGSIALLNVQHAEEQAKVAIQDESKVGQYVAISHVWADGHGNLEANALPTCVLEKLQKNVDALGISSPGSHTPIWMDTICLPRYPLDLRREAVLRLSDVFSKACGVLVLDSYLQAVDCSDMPPVELLARISISGWTSRLWAFSEGYLAKRIWFQFRDKAIDLHGLMSRWHDELTPRIPANPLTGVSYEMTTLYSATGLLGRRQDEEQRLELGEIKTALNSRQTSWSSDEALCLGAILELDLSPIVYADGNKKMAAFWRQIESVPIDILFFKCLPRLEDPGSRWAPATMLGGANPDLGNLSLDVGRYATPTENGLVFTMDLITPVDTLAPIADPAGDSLGSKRNFMDICRQPPTGHVAGKEIILKDEAGTWYSCLARGPWHQTSTIPAYEHDIPVIFLLVKNKIDNIREQHDLEDWTRNLGVFATYQPSEAPLRAKAHTLVVVNELLEEKWQSFDELASCAVAFMAQDQQGELETGSDGDVMVDSIVEWLRSRHTEAALIDLVTGVLPPELARMDVKSRLRVCARYVRYFCLVGDWHKVKTSIPGEVTTWCID